MTDIDNNAGLKNTATIPEAQIVGSNSPIEEDDTYKGKVKVINSLTGEVMEREYNSVHDIKLLYQEIAASKLAMGRAADKLKSLLEQFMSNYDEYKFADGDVSYWVAPEKKEISYSVVAEALGEDVASLFSTVSITKLKDYLSECVQRKEMSYEDMTEILSNSRTVPGKAYVKIGRKK